MNMKHKLFFTLTAVLAILPGCTGGKDADGLKMSREEAKAMDFLYGSMSIADIGDYDSTYFLGNVRTALKARKEMDWGRQVPEQLFMHFVLPPRVNNERLDDFRTMYYDTLKARVAGLSMKDAALEINHWCHEKVTYTPSDARTSSPLASMLNAEGRCGEESTFTVAAMRTVGIPARQVYTPRWAHTDDNHAWVEVWTDGKWSFLGACEPEAALNMAWFNEPAARAMLMHTLVFGDYHGDEDIIRRTHSFTEINVIGNYVKTRNNIVRIIDGNGNPVSGAVINFCIYNYGEFYPAVTLKSGEDGTASLHTGLGDMLVWAYKDGCFGKALLSGNGDNAGAEPECRADIALTLTDSDLIAEDIDINPPAPGKIPAEADEAAVEANKLRLAVEDSIRLAYKATFAGDIPDAKGNWREIKAFLEYAESCGQRGRAMDILDNISRKDVRDTDRKVLKDALDSAPVLAEGYDGSLYAAYVLCPRIGGEFLQPYHDAIRAALVPETGQSPEPEAVIGWCEKNIANADSLNPRRLQATPAGTLKTRKADSRSKDIFTVAALRTFGIPARIDILTGKAQYVSRESGEWLGIGKGTGTGIAPSKGWITIRYTPGEGTLDNPEYYRHFTISRLDGGARRVLEFEGGDATELGADASAKYFSRPFQLETGAYLLTTGSRMASGKVLARMVSFIVDEGKTTDVSMIMRQAPEDVGVIGSMDAEKTYTPLESIGAAVREGDLDKSILSTTGRGYFLFVVAGSGDEPTNHALRDLAGIKDVLAGWNRPILILSSSARDASTLKMPEGEGGQFLADNAHFGIDNDNAVRTMICDGCHSKSSTLPVVALCDSFGRIVYLSTGYNTSLGIQLRNVIGKL